MASPGKVLIVVQNLPVPFDRRVWLEATTLRQAGYQVAVISPKGSKGTYGAGHEVIDGVSVYRYPAPPDASGFLGYVFEFIYCWLFTAILMLRVLRDQGVDVLHACNPPETFFVLGRLLKLFGKRFIFDHHDLSPEMYVAKGGRKGGMLHAGLIWMERMTFAAADVVIAPNHSHKEIALERGRVPADRIFIVRSGPDFRRLRLMPEEPDLKMGKPFLACYLGEMCPQDGVDYLLHSIRHFIFEMNRRDTYFVLMGGGPALASLRRLKGELGLDDWVLMPGRVSDDDLCRYLSTADVCLDPDPYTEWADRSTMNKIMEYMAFGKPIVAFQLRENAFSAGEAALMVEPNDVVVFADGIARLLDDPGLRARMGELGQKRVAEELAWEFSQPPLLAAYRRLHLVKPGIPRLERSSDVLGIHISPINMPMALATIEDWIVRRESHYVTVTPGHAVMDAYHDPELRRIFMAGGMTTPDGMSIVWTLKLKGYKRVSRIYGPDLMLAVCVTGLTKGYRHFLYGGEESVADLLKTKLTLQFPGLKVCGTYAPPFGDLSPDEDKFIVDTINAAGPDVVWVGLSSPKQERWMAAYRSRLQAPVLIGVGAAFDFISGRKRQAPRWMQQTGLEWAFRLALEPRRMWPRYRQYPKYVLLVLAQLLGLRQFPEPETPSDPPTAGGV